MKNCPTCGQPEEMNNTIALMSAQIHAANIIAVNRIKLYNLSLGYDKVEFSTEAMINQSVLTAKAIYSKVNQ